MSSAWEEALLEDGYDPSEVEREVSGGPVAEAAKEGAERLSRKLDAGPGPGEAERSLRELLPQHDKLPPRLRDAPAPQLRHQVPNGRVEQKVFELLVKLRGADTPAQREACARLASLLVLALNEVHWQLSEAEAGARVEERLARQARRGAEDLTLASLAAMPPGR